MFLPHPYRVVLAALLVAMALLLTSACRSSAKPAAAPPPPKLQQIQREPTIRVRIAQGVGSVRLTGAGGLWVGARDASSGRTFTAPLTIGLRDGRFVISHGGEHLAWPLPELRVKPVHAENHVLVDGVAYPHELLLHVSGSAIDVVNHVPLEQYLPGVLSREMYRSWQPAAFRAQAIAARSYALWECSRTLGRHFDLESTVASQAYGGAEAHDTARQAVRDTAGIVLEYDGRVLPAFYSACNGGIGQDAIVAFPQHGIDWPPLRGQQTQQWAHYSKHYNWGPIRRTRADLSARIAAWGRNSNHPVSQLRDLRAVEITARNEVGRPGRFTLTDASGARYHLTPEAFRFACNFEGPGLPSLPAEAKLKSALVSPRLLGNDVLLEGGHGFGHGVGLSQWGAQAMAEHGYNAAAILGLYYPGAGLKRLY